MKAGVYLRDLPEFFVEWDMFQTKVVEKIEKHVFHSFPKIFTVYTKMWKYSAEPSRPQITIGRVILTWYRTVLFGVTRSKCQLECSLITVMTFSLLIPTDSMMMAGS